MEQELDYIEASLQSSKLSAGLEALQKLLSKAKSSQSALQLILERLSNFGKTLVDNSNYDAIFPLFKILCKLCWILQDFSRLCDLKNSLSFCYRACGQSNLAIKECLDAIQIAGNHKALINKLPALHLNACAIYMEDVKNLHVAKSHAELAFFFAKDQSKSGLEKDKRTLAVASYNYALVLEESNERTQAIHWYREGLKFCQEKWNDLRMEKAFREKISSLSATGQLKTPMLFKKRHTSHGNGPARMRQSFVRESEPSDRSTSQRHRESKREKRMVSPISNNRFHLKPIQFDKSWPIPSEHSNPTRGSAPTTGDRSYEARGSAPNHGTRTQRYRMESFSFPRSKKLSLVQSVIKIQKWYRKLKNIYCIFLKFDYISIAIKSYLGVKYFICIFKDLRKMSFEGTEYCIEAWPLVKRVSKPAALWVDLKQLCEAVSVEANEELLREKGEIAVSCVEVSQGRLVLKKNYLVFEGEKEISGRTYKILIRVHGRFLDIEAAAQKKKFKCSMRLDPLQDLANVKSKVPLLLENLTIFNGSLNLNLN